MADGKRIVSCCLANLPLAACSVLDNSANAVLSTNHCFLSSLQTTKAFLPKMMEMNHGHIVTVASSLGLFSTAGVEVSSNVVYQLIIWFYLLSSQDTPNPLN